MGTDFPGKSQPLYIKRKRYLAARGRNLKGAIILRKRGLQFVSWMSCCKESGKQGNKGKRLTGTKLLVKSAEE